MARIDIVRDEVTGAVSFEPAILELTVADKGVETVLFRNLDTREAHWPAVVGQANSLWFPRPLGAFTGKRPRTSRTLVLVGNPAGFTISFACALHPGEAGSIRVVPPVTP
jgi:hypothetical protein